MAHSSGPLTGQPWFFWKQKLCCINQLLRPVLYTPALWFMSMSQRGGREGSLQPQPCSSAVPGAAVPQGEEVHGLMGPRSSGPSCPHDTSTGGAVACGGGTAHRARHQREEDPKWTQAEVGSLRARREWNMATQPQPPKPLARGGPTRAEGKSSRPGVRSLPASLLTAPITASSNQLPGPCYLALTAQPV